MQVGELVSMPSLGAELAKKCPFNEKKHQTDPMSPEDIGDDDKDEVQPRQSNNGGILGENLEAGRKGKADTGPYPPTDFLYREPANDSKRGRMSRLHMKSYRDAAGGDFPFTVAAHHLIPGNASLYKAEVKLLNYMESGKKVKSIDGKEYTLDGDIGYDVNGSHNGVWLPGNYAIKTELAERTIKGKVYPAREGTTPIEDVSWADLSTRHEPWQFAYVAGAAKAAMGQWHDSHERPYSAAVRANLNKIVTALATHLGSSCDDCSGKSTLPPPYRIKRRLYAISKRLRQYCAGPPQGWKSTWFTSERWGRKYIRRGKLTREFYKAYTEGVETRPHVIRGG